MPKYTVIGSTPGDVGVYKAKSKLEALAIHVNEGEIELQIIIDGLRSEFPELDRTGEAGDYRIRETELHNALGAVFVSPLQR